MKYCISMVANGSARVDGNGKKRATRDTENIGAARSSSSSSNSSQHYSLRILDSAVGDKRYFCGSDDTLNNKILKYAFLTGN